MYGLLDGVAGPSPTRPAREVLRALMSSLGAAGLRAAADHPRLLASVDQHAAAVRDSLAPAGIAGATDRHGLAVPDGPDSLAVPDGPDSLAVPDGPDSLAAPGGPGGLAAPADRARAARPDDPATGHATLNLASLAGYAEGVRETALAHGWRPPAGSVDWSAALGNGDWILLRLLAVCALARDLGVEPAPVAPPARRGTEGEAPPAG